MPKAAIAVLSQAQGLTIEMFASQWFLSMYAAKFPVEFSFRIIDLFLVRGCTVLLSAALVLFRRHGAALLSRDFEGLLRELGTAIPNAYQSAEAVEQFMADLARRPVSDRKLRKIDKSWAKTEIVVPSPPSPPSKPSQPPVQPPGTTRGCVSGRMWRVRVPDFQLMRIPLFCVCESFASHKQKV